MARVRSNRVCFTLNNYDWDYGEQLEEFAQINKDIITFMCAGHEIGSNGTPHIQGFIHIKKDRKECGVNFWRNFMPQGKQCHFENAHGTDEQSMAYCSKEGPFGTWGEPTAARDKFQQIFETAKKDINEAVALDFEFGIRNYNALKTIFDDNNKPKMEERLEKLRDWQIRALQKLDNQSDRQILFIVDEEGGKGKSVLCKHLLSTKKSWACQGECNFVRSLAASRGGGPP